jgi:hypothetical protein
MMLWLVLLDIALWFVATLCTSLEAIVELVFVVYVRSSSGLSRPSSYADFRFRIDIARAAMVETGLELHGEFFGGGSGGSLPMSSSAVVCFASCICLSLLSILCTYVLNCGGGPSM